MKPNKQQPIRQKRNWGHGWYLNGKLHREDGPAIERNDGYKAWFINGKRHRVDGPARVWPQGGEEWYLNDELHRNNGPAIECENGDKRWYYNGISYTKRDYYRKLVKLGLCTKQEAFVELL